MKTNYGGVDYKNTTLSPKIMPTSSRRLGGSSPESYSLHPAIVIGKHDKHTQYSLFNTHIQQLFIIHIQQLLIIHPWIQSRLHRMKHAPDSTLRCNVVHTNNNQTSGNSLSVSTRHSHLGNCAEFVETTQLCT